MPHSFSWNLTSPAAPPVPGQPGDHRFDTLARILKYMRAQPRFEGMLLAFADAVDSADVAVAALGPMRNLDFATDIYLELLGKIVGEARAGLDDAHYRQAIRARIRADLSSGTIEEILSTLALVLPPTATIELTEYQPAAIVVRVGVEPLGAGAAANLALCALLLRILRAAGINTILEYLPDPQTEAQSFGFFDSDGLGFGDVADPGVGGGLISAVST